jgi:hypothetical protein
MWAGGVWGPDNTAGCELFIPSNGGAPTPIFSLDPLESRKILGRNDCPARGEKSHLEHIKIKVNAWINKVKKERPPPIFHAMDSLQIQTVDRRKI